MARHRRYPVKKTKKVKSKDPIQRMADRLFSLPILFIRLQTEESRAKERGIE